MVTLWGKSHSYNTGCKINITFTRVTLQTIRTMLSHIHLPEMTKHISARNGHCCVNKSPRSSQENAVGTITSAWQLSHMEICSRLELMKEKLPSSVARQHAWGGLSTVTVCLLRALWRNRTKRVEGRAITVLSCLCERALLQTCQPQSWKWELYNVNEQKV